MGGALCAPFCFLAAGNASAKALIAQSGLQIMAYILRSCQLSPCITRHLGKVEHPQNRCPALGPDFTVRISSALPLGCWVTATFEVLHMFAVGGESWRAAAGLQGVQHGVDFSFAEYRLLE